MKVVEILLMAGEVPVTGVPVAGMYQQMVDSEHSKTKLKINGNYSAPHLRYIDF